MKRSDRWYSAVLQWCGGWRLGVGGGGRGLVPVSSCDFGFGPQIQVSLRSRWLRLIIVMSGDPWYFAVLRWCRGWWPGVGEGGRGLVPVSACDFGFGPRFRAVVWPVCRRLVIVVLGDRWSFAVCGLGVVAGCVAVGACMDWTGFRLVYSDSVRVSGVFGGRDGCCWLSWYKRILDIPRVCGSSVIGGPLLPVPVED